MFGLSRRLSTWHGPHLLLSAVAPAIDRYLLSEGRSAANPPHAEAAAVDRWDRQTDRRTLARFVDSAAHTVQEVSIKIWKYELAVQNAMLSVDWVWLMSKVLRPTRYKIGNFGNVIPSQSLGSILKKTTPKNNLDNAKSKKSNLTQNTQKYKLNL